MATPLLNGLPLSSQQDKELKHDTTPTHKNGHWKGDPHDLIWEGNRGADHGDSDLNIGAGTWIKTDDPADKTSAGADTDAPSTSTGESVPDLLSPGYLDWQRGHYAGNTKIRFNSEKTPKANASLFLHEATHAISDEGATAKRIVEGNLAAPDILDDPVAGLGPELADIIRSANPAQADVMRTDLQTPSDGDLNKPEYPLIATERRSFLNQAFSGAVNSGDWKRMPKTKAELYAAFYNTVGGVKLDPAQQDEMNRVLASKEGQQALHDFPAPQNLDPKTEQAISYIQAGLNQLTPEQRLQYYQKVLPQDYGELQERVYNNPNGRSDLGLEPSANYAIAFTDHVLTSHYRNQDSWTQADYDRVAQKMAGEKEDPQVFDRVCKAAIANGNDQALQSLLKTTDARFKDDPKGAQAEKNRLLADAVQAMAQAHKNLPQSGADGPTTQQYFANLNKSVATLIKAGADPKTMVPGPDGKPISCEDLLRQNNHFQPTKQEAEAADHIYTNKALADHLSQPGTGKDWWTASDYKWAVQGVDKQNFAPLLKQAVDQGNVAAIHALLETTDGPNPRNSIAKEEKQKIYQTLWSNHLDKGDKGEAESWTKQDYEAVAQHLSVKDLGAELNKVSSNPMATDALISARTGPDSRSPLSPEEKTRILGQVAPQSVNGEISEDRNPRAAFDLIAAGADPKGLSKEAKQILLTWEAKDLVEKKLTPQEIAEHKKVLQALIKSGAPIDDETRAILKSQGIPVPPSAPAQASQATPSATPQKTPPNDQQATQAPRPPLVGARHSGEIGGASAPSYGQVAEVATH